MSGLSDALSVLPVEQRTIVRHSADKLRKEFRGTFGVETIELYLASSLLSLQAARIKNFVPLFSERFARQRLRALTRVEGKMTGTVPSVVFLCTHNAGRSQMAAAWAKSLGGDRLEVFSGGSDPASEVNPAAIEAMREVGIDIKGEFPKPWTDEVSRRDHHHGMWRRLPDLSWQAVRGLGGRRPRWSRCRAGATHTRRHRVPCEGIADAARSHVGQRARGAWRLAPVRGDRPALVQ
jgi:hypothetical protein